MIWFLCPFSRPEQMSHIEKIWLSQELECNLLVVANGCKYNGKATKVITLSEKGAVLSLNIGLSFLRANHPNCSFARMDDDDEYKPGYIFDVHNSLKNADWSAIPVTNIKLTNGEIIQFGSHSLTAGSGGTLAAKINCAHDFNDCFPVEDSRWCKEMIQSNFKFCARKSDNYLRIRHSGCYSEMTDEQFRLFGVCP